MEYLDLNFNLKSNLKSELLVFLESVLVQLSGKLSHMSVMVVLLQKGTFSCR